MRIYHYRFADARFPSPIVSFAPVAVTDAETLPRRPRGEGSVEGTTSASSEASELCSERRRSVYPGMSEKQTSKV